MAKNEFKKFKDKIVYLIDRYEPNTGKADTSIKYKILKIGPVMCTVSEVWRKDGMIYPKPFTLKLFTKDAMDYKQTLYPQDSSIPYRYYCEWKYVFTLAPEEDGWDADFNM